MERFIVEVEKVEQLEGKKPEKVVYLAEVYDINMRTKPVQFLIYSEEYGFEMVSFLDCIPVETE